MTSDPMTTTDGVAHRLGEALEDLESPATDGAELLATMETVRTLALASIARELRALRGTIEGDGRDAIKVAWETIATGGNEAIRELFAADRYDRYDREAQARARAARHR